MTPCAHAAECGSQTLVLDELTPREREVALLIARGFSNRRIAQDLVIAQGTAASHVAHIIGKLGLPNRTGIAAVVAAQNKALDLSPDLEPIPDVTPSRSTPKPTPRADFVRRLDRRFVDAERDVRVG